MKYIFWECTTIDEKVTKRIFDFPFSQGYVTFIGEEISRKKVKQYLYSKFYEYKVKHIFTKVVHLIFTYETGESVVVMDKTKNGS